MPSPIGELIAQERLDILALFRVPKRGPGKELVRL
jgi:hypothetical protein